MLVRYYPFMSKGFDTAVEMSGQIAGQNQFTVYEDFNHGDPANGEFFYSDKHIDRLGEAGVKHIGVEHPPEAQKPIDCMVSIGAAKADGKKLDPKKIDEAVEKYAQHMSENFLA